MARNPVTIIAEAGVNHNGSLDRALQLVDCASEAGADIVKFQTFRAKELVSHSAQKAEYQVRNSGGGSQLEMLQRLELSEDAHRALLKRCKQMHIEFLSTPFDFGSVDFLASGLGLKTLKIGSGELTNAPLLLKAARTGCKLILSSGMANLEEVTTALSVVTFGFLEKTAAPSVRAFTQAFESDVGQTILKEKVSLLHCTTEYPAPFEDTNLRAMDTLSQTFGLTIGLSDHTEGYAVPVAAVARGAVIIEKHFTLDRNLPGPDHKASLEPAELKAMIKAIREVEAALGTGIKAAAPSEIKNAAVARKSLVARSPIRKGDTFTENNLSVKRPGNGIAPIRYWDYLGKTADRNYEEDELIQ